MAAPCAGAGWGAGPVAFARCAGDSPDWKAPFNAADLWGAVWHASRLAAPLAAEDPRASGLNNWEPHHGRPERLLPWLVTPQDREGRSLRVYSIPAYLQGFAVFEHLLPQPGWTSSTVFYGQRAVKLQANARLLLRNDAPNCLLYVLSADRGATVLILPAGPA